MMGDNKWPAASRSLITKAEALVLLKWYTRVFNQPDNSQTAEVARNCLTQHVMSSTAVGQLVISILYGSI